MLMLQAWQFLYEPLILKDKTFIVSLILLDGYFLWQFKVRDWSGTKYKHFS